MTHKRNRISGLLAAVLLLASVLNVQSKDDDDKSKKENVGTVIGIDLGTTYSWSALLLIAVNIAMSFVVGSTMHFIVCPCCQLVHVNGCE